MAAKDALRPSCLSGEIPPLSCLGGIPRFFQPGPVFSIYIEGKRNAYTIRDGLGPDDPQHTKQGIQQEQHRDVKGQPPDHTQKQGNAAFAKGLENVYGEKAQEHQGGSKHPDAKELGSQRHRLGFLDKQVGKLGGKQLVQPDADPGNDQAQAAGHVNSVLHAAFIFRRIVIGHQGHHPLADTDTHI